MGLSPAYHPLIVALWYLLPLAIMEGEFKTPCFKEEVN